MSKGSESVKKWTLSHPEEAKRRKAEYYQRKKHDPEFIAKRKAYDAEYRMRPEVKIRNVEKQKRYVARHPEVKKAYNKAYSSTPEFRERRKLRRKLNPDKVTPEQRERKNARQREYRKTDEGRAKHKDNTLKRRRGFYIVESVNRAELYRRYNGTCQYCGGKLEEGFHVEHMIPAARYHAIGKLAPHGYEYVVPSCSACNLAKFKKTPLEFFFQMA